ncbi:LAFE_0G13124g1_1 [Lachancea fermentati]|uniref:LAFE_0G13124g1_1 n=1 Tax=Lachancea fermentati TaxID=4955 RepID=A0A1G4MIB8_LACFM|nr:LAFE_0G13124g1_1 [Lachancea fermentati]
MTAARRGVRDTARLQVAAGRLPELYWDAILLAESEFLVEGHADYGAFQRHVVAKVGQAITINDRALKPQRTHLAPGASPGTLWRHIGAVYSLIYYPDWFPAPLWCKCNLTHLQVTLPYDISRVAKPLLMSLLEYASTLNLVWLRLYVRRDVVGIKALLRNLNWLGGHIVPNEDRARALDTLSLVEGAMFADDKYIVLEFEC